jgi:hypothetical protein
VNGSTIGLVMGSGSCVHADHARDCPQVKVASERIDEQHT